MIMRFKPLRLNSFRFFQWSHCNNDDLRDQSQISLRSSEKLYPASDRRTKHFVGMLSVNVQHRKFSFNWEESNRTANLKIKLKMLLTWCMSTDRECFVIYSKLLAKRTEASESISLQMTQGSVLEAAIFTSWKNCFYAVFNSKINNTRCHCIGWYFWSTDPYVMSREFSHKKWPTRDVCWKTTDVHVEIQPFIPQATCSLLID